MNHKDQTQLGHYKILQKLGAGGMGEVYLAEDTKLEHQIAAISGVTAAGKIHAVRFHTTAHLTTHSTGARVSLSFIENLSVKRLNTRPVNSSVRRCGRY